jgi:hypothetical protein
MPANVTAFLLLRDSFPRLVGIERQGAFVTACNIVKIRGVFWGHSATSYWKEDCFLPWPHRELQAMFDTIRLAFYVLILMGVVAAAVLGQPDGTNDLSLNVPSLRYWLCPELKRKDELTKSSSTEFRQMAFKYHALQKLLDNKATLFETAAVFYRLNQEWDVKRFALDYPDCSAEELACRQVIRWVENSSEENSQLAVRLEEELRLYKERYGAVHFPNVEPQSQLDKTRLPESRISIKELSSDMEDR